MMLDSKPEIYKPENFIKTIPEKVNSELHILIIFTIIFNIFLETFFSLVVVK